MKFMKFFLGIALLISFISISGCSRQAVYGPLKTVIARKEDSIKLDEHTSVIEFSSKSGNVEFYSWNREEIKCEIIRRIHGDKDGEDLKDGRENFGITTEQSGEKVVISTWYKGSKKEQKDAKADLKLFLPKNISKIILNIEDGKVKFYDDLFCNLQAVVDSVDVDINYIHGILDIEAGQGGIRVGGGMLKEGTRISTGTGNIVIDCSLENGGSYTFETGLGNIGLSLPAAMDMNLESEGYLKINEFPDFDGATCIKAICKIGRIEIRKKG